MQGLNFCFPKVMKKQRKTGKLCESLMKNMDNKTIFARHRIAVDGLRFIV